MTERLSREEKDRIYQEGVELLPEYGWPAWPPKEVPPLEKWWEEEIIVLPSSKRHLEQPPYMKIFEITGSPQSGKDTLQRKADQQLYSIFKKNGIDLHIWSEIFKSTGRAFRNLPPPPIGGPEVDDFMVFSYSHDKKDWFNNLWMQLVKLLYWEAWIDVIQTSPESPQAFMGSRGLTDVLIWLYALTAHQGDKKFSIPSDFREILDFNPSLARAQAGISNIDAIVLMGISQREAKKRREQAGRTDPGHVTDSPFFNDLNAWYSHLVKEVLPQWHESWGTGYLILNGEDPLDKNVRRLTSFIRWAS